MQNNHPDLVLVIDDDPAIRLLSRATLEHDGFQVIEAPDGDTGVALFAQSRPDIVLLDVMMPGKDGFSTCSELRRLSPQSPVPVLMMTGLDDVDSINRAYQAGATDFVTKPINWPVLGHRVRYILRSSRALAELAESQRSLAEAHRLAGLSTWEWDIEMDSMRWSKEIYHSLGIVGFDPPHTSITFWNLVHPDDQTHVRNHLVAALKREAPFDVDYRIIVQNDEVQTIHAQAETLFRSDGRAVRMRGTIQNITDRKRSEEQIRQLAFYDTLTGLPNRFLFQEQLELALQQSVRDDAMVALLFLDLDNFKRINDTLGHRVGDQLLEQVAKRLFTSVRSEDRIHRSESGELLQTVARLGGDEFTVMVNHIDQPEDAARVAQRILHILAEPSMVDGHELFVSTSIGIAICPSDGKDMQTLLKNADIAMYHAKAQGRGHYQFYNSSMNATALEKLELESSIRRALDRNEFILFYQPRMDGASGKVVGNEALLRWRHPVKGLLVPADFIGLMEETGLIVPIGAWVIKEACRQNKAWQDAGLPAVPVSVNISSLQFRQPDLAEVIRRALSVSNLDGRYLELEVTESMLMQDAESTVRNLKQLGILISIDDFGTGFSSLNYLKRFPVDALKIDRSFVKHVDSDRDNAAIARAIIALARSLDLSVVAEGVETSNERHFLFENGCLEMQGFLFSRPIEPDALARLWKSGDLLSAQASG
jgi:diguanylate cyclase (GGDEF)-like protein